MGLNLCAVRRDGVENLSPFPFFRRDRVVVKPDLKPVPIGGQSHAGDGLWSIGSTRCLTGVRFRAESAVGLLHEVEEGGFALPVFEILEIRVGQNLPKPLQGRKGLRAPNKTSE